jgi:hypothetical protein
MPPSLVGRGIKYIRIPRIDLDVGDPGVLVDAKRLRPVLAGIGGLVEAPLATGRPERPLGRHIDHVAVPWVDHDLADVLGGLEPHPLPGPAAVEALVDTVPPADMPATDVLTGADPDDIGIRRIDGHRTDRIGGLVVEDRSPGDTGVFGFPDAPGAHRQIPGAAVPGADRDVGDPTTHQGRTDATQRETADGFGGNCRAVLGGRVSRAGGGQTKQSKTQANSG